MRSRSGKGVNVDFEIERRAANVVEAQFERFADAELFAAWLDISGRALFAEFVAKPGDLCCQPGCLHYVAPGEALCEGCLDLAKAR